MPPLSAQWPWTTCLFADRKTLAQSFGGACAAWGRAVPKRPDVVGTQIMGTPCWENSQLLIIIINSSS